MESIHVTFCDRAWMECMCISNHPNGMHAYLSVSHSVSLSVYIYMSIMYIWMHSYKYLYSHVDILICDSYARVCSAAAAVGPGEGGGEVGGRLGWGHTHTNTLQSPNILDIVSVTNGV